MNKRRGLSSRNGVLFHKQLIRTAIRLRVPHLEVASRNQVRKLQVVQCKSLRIMTNATWCFNNKRIHKYPEVQFLSAHHHSINLRFRLQLVSKTTELGTRNALARTMGSPWSPDESDQKSAASRRLPIKRFPSRHNVFGRLNFVTGRSCSPQSDPPSNFVHPVESFCHCWEHRST